MSIVEAPQRSYEQRMEALGRANDVRIKRGRLKKNIKAGDVSATQILEEPPDYVDAMKVFDLLMARPKTGSVKAAKLLNQCRISQSKTIGGLSDRQRHELIDLLNSNA